MSRSQPNEDHLETSVVIAKAHRLKSQRGTTDARREFALARGTSSSRRVQAQCFTPRKTLPRSPLQSRHSPSALHRQDDLQPLRPKWEIPRTPVLGKRPGSQAFPSPLLSCTVAVAGPWTNDGEATKRGGSSEGGKKSAVIPLAPGTLPCTLNDLDFLDQMKNLKTCEQLQSRLMEVERKVKSAEQERELLIEQGEKVLHDLEEMRREYKKTAHTVRSLLNQSAQQDCDLVSTTSLDPSLSPTPVSSLEQQKLVRMRQLASVELDRVTVAVNERKKQLQAQKDFLEAKIREREEQLCQVQESIGKEINRFKEDRTTWESKVRLLCRQHDFVEATLNEKEGEMREVHLSASQEVVEEAEKERARQRLGILVRRVELYIDRRNRLGRMSSQTRRK